MHGGSVFQGLDITKGKSAVPKQLLKLSLSFFALNTRSTLTMRGHIIRCLPSLCQALLISNSVASNLISLPASWTANITNQLSTLLPIGRPGGQDFIHCCATALSTFSTGSDLTDISVDPFSRNSQYPCGATYQGDSAGAPAVKITYRWCHEQCPGWQVSKPDKLTQWLQPFVGFILPAVIFSLNVPRRRKIQPPAWVFPEDIEKFTSLMKALICALSAALIVTIDTIIWLCIVFAVAGPLLLSGLYEAWIDKRVVDYMSRKNNIDDLPLALRSRILIAVLVGNLDLDGAWMSAMDIAEPLETRAANGDPAPLRLQIQELEATDAISNIQKRISSMLACQYSFGSTIGAPVVFYIGSFIYAVLEIRAQLGDNDTSHALAFGMWWMTIPHIAIVSGCLLAGNNPDTLEAIVPVPSGPSIQSNIPSGSQSRGSQSRGSQSRGSQSRGSQSRGSQSRGSQSRGSQSRGSQSRGSQSRGSQSGLHISTTGEGMITFVNSNTQRQSNPEAPDREWLRKMLPDFGPTYDARYQPQWMINRGRSKREWLFCLIELHKRRTLSLTDEARVQLNGLQETLHMKWGDWMTLIVFAISLFMIPCMFGFLVAYLTPQIGVSCRSFTVLMYATSQVGLLLLWLWDVTWRDEKWHRRRMGAKVYPNVMSPNLAIQPPVSERTVENQEAQQGLPTNDASPPHIDSGSTVPIARTDNQHGDASESFPMVPITSTTPTTSVHTTQPAMTTSQTASSMNLVDPQGSNEANAADVEAGPGETRHPSEAGTVIPHGLFARTISFLAKARWSRPNHNGSALSRTGAVVYGILMALLLSLAVLSSIGGTVMQIVGVYRTCLCQINVSSWLWGRNPAFLTASTNTSQDIRLAHDTWIPIGFVAAFFLGVIAYIAWWYQRRLRFRFALLLGNSYTGVFNNEMRKPRRNRPSPASSVDENSSGVGTPAYHPPSRKIPNGNPITNISEQVNRHVSN